MAVKILLFVFFLLKLTSSDETNFILNGFSGANLSLDGAALIRPNGLLELTNDNPLVMGHVFYPIPVRFKSAAGKILTFSTTFVFAMASRPADFGGAGITFLISRSTNFSTAFPNQYLGLFNEKSLGKQSNHVFAVELDTADNSPVQDIDDNHVGIDYNTVISNVSHPAGYYEDGSGLFKNLSLIGGESMQLWIDFDGEKLQLNVTLSRVQMPKPKRPLLSSNVDLASIILDTMHIGFSAATSSFHTYHYILGWSFKMNGSAEQLDYAKLPSVPRVKKKGNSVDLGVWLPAAASCSTLLIFVAILFMVRRRNKYAELLEDWESEYGPHRFSYKDLFQATNGFKEERLLGTGGFGRVYGGVLSDSKMQVAVKRVSHDSRQGMREFVAEIVSIGQLRHRNLVQLLGYCRRSGELLLVYDFMPNGSLDKFLFGDKKPTLSWAQRFRIIKGVASGLLYLHEDWEQVVLHRDIKASNVLLDGELNGRLGDFGLASLYDRGSDLSTTHVVGTMGYLAPELATTGKATTQADVFAFGIFMQEVVCGRRPVEPSAGHEQPVILSDWVLDIWCRGLLMEAVDKRLGEEYCAYEVELVLKLGLLCSHPLPESRPSMRQVTQILNGDVDFPEFLLTSLSSSSLSQVHNVGFDDFIKSFTSLDGL